MRTVVPHEIATEQVPLPRPGNGRRDPGNLTIESFCNWAPCSRAHAYRQLNSGALKARKVGRRTVIVNALEWHEGLPAY